MKLEFKARQHYGRHDFYPSNEAARQVLRLKRRFSGQDSKSLKLDELEILKQLGFDVVMELETTTFKKLG